MHTELKESSLLRFAELLAHLKETRAADDLITAMETIAATACMGDRTTSEWMCHLLRVVSGIQMGFGESFPWGTIRLH